MPHGDPIFILGMTRRSGTNFAFELLSLHPGVVPARRISEDFALHDAELLREYARRVHAHWNPRWGFAADAEARLLRALGRGLSEFLVDEALAEGAAPAGRPLFKTPSVRNLELLLELFPAAALLLIVRDGRDVVESYVRSFAWSHEQATREWCRGARAVLDFERAQRGGAATRHRVVRYEELLRDPEGTLAELLTFLGLDAARYNLEAARKLPVFGSSTFRGEHADLHWQPVERTAEFDPIGRWQAWDGAARRRFAWLAGDLMAQLGYDAPAPISARERAQERASDAAYGLRELARRVLAAGRVLRGRAPS